MTVWIQPATSDAEDEDDGAAAVYPRCVQCGGLVAPGKRHVSHDCVETLLADRSRLYGALSAIHLTADTGIAWASNETRVHVRAVARDAMGTIIKGPTRTPEKP